MTYIDGLELFGTLLGSLWHSAVQVCRILRITSLRSLLQLVDLGKNMERGSIAASRNLDRITDSCRSTPDSCNAVAMKDFEAYFEQGEFADPCKNTALLLAATCVD